MADAQESRRMKYPYTFTAKLVQFPWKHYYKHSLISRYIVVSAILVLPLFYKITQLSYSPENVKKWKEIRRQMYEGGGHH